MINESISKHGYDIIEEIGVGGFGVVYRANQKTVGRDVAIKVILPEIARDEIFIKRFEQEARLAARLEHPNIVPLYDYWQDEDGAYLAMRWLRGGNLKESLTDGPWDLEAALRLMEQLAGALDAAHSQGVIHRDLKPSNILLDDRGNAYLADFGIAKHLVGTTMGTPTGAIIGSPAYMSPEQITGGEVTLRSDLYSFGMVVFELLSGEPPFGDVEPTTMLYKQIHEAIPLLAHLIPTIPPDVDAVLQRATAKNPGDRFSSASDFLDSLRASMKSAVRRPDAVEEVTMPTLPEFLQESGGDARQRVFVARQSQLDLLERQLDESLQGTGRVALVTGEAGSGKSALMQTFAESSQEKHRQLLVAWGRCDAFSGAGDPYLPFRDMMRVLTGDVESSFRLGTLTRMQARNLWEAMPQTITIVAGQGAELLDVLLSGSSLLDRARSIPHIDVGRLQQLQWVTSRESPGQGSREQENLFETVSSVLHSISVERPLLLILDDLQWADQASLNLLFHLGRRLADSRILILGGYRSGEASLGEEGGRRQLARVITEFKRIFGEITIDLDKADASEARALVESLIDAEPNRLSKHDREALYRHTGGQALFTVELLRELKDRGELLQDDEGFWCISPTIDWDVLPARVEGVIEEQLSRLEPDVREILSVASVSGDDFSAQMVADIQKVSERQVVRLLSTKAAGGLGLVNPLGEQRVGQQKLWCFGFRHSLYRHYLYQQLSSFERNIIHGDVAEALEEMYAGQTEKIAVQLAHHYLESGNDDKAIEYALLAGDQARAKYANNEAAHFYEKALAIFKEQKNYEQAARTLMKLGLTYHTAFDYEAARSSYDEGFSFWSLASELHRDIPSAPAIHPLRLVDGEPTTLDPAEALDVWSSLLIDQLFDGLVAQTADLDIVPLVANKWEILEDGKRYLLHLREDYRWSDGSLVTAQDFEYALQRRLSSQFLSRTPWMLFDIKGARAYHYGELSDWDLVGIKASDKQTLIIDLEKPAGHFMHVITTLTPLQKSLIEKHGDSWTEPGTLVGNGPFILKSWKHGEHLRLERNPYYSGTFPGNLEQVLIRFDPDWEEMLNLYDAEELDIISATGPTLRDFEIARQRFAADYVSNPWLQVTFLRFDTTRPPFDDARVRQAFVMALDKEKLADVHLGGTSYPGTGGIIPLGLAGHSPTIGLPYDPPAARALLREAGFIDVKIFPDLKLVGAGSGEFTWIRESLSAQWKENLGFDLAWKSVDWAASGRDDWEWPHIFQGGWVASIPDPDYSLRYALTNFSVDISAEPYRGLFEKARETMEQEKRLDIYREADRLLVEDARLVPLLYGRGHNFVKPWIKGYAVPPHEIVEFKNVVIEPH